MPVFKELHGKLAIGEFVSLLSNMKMLYKMQCNSFMLLWFSYDLFSHVYRKSLWNIRSQQSV
jgi:hypothetical protein